MYRPLFADVFREGKAKNFQMMTGFFPTADQKPYQGCLSGLVIGFCASLVQRNRSVPERSLLGAG
jgi:hypothetical protein